MTPPLPHRPSRPPSRPPNRRMLAAVPAIAMLAALGTTEASAALPSVVPVPVAAPIAAPPIVPAAFSPGAVGLRTPAPTEIARRSRCDELRRRAASRRDDGTLNAQDYRSLRRRGCG